MKKKKKIVGGAAAVKAAADKIAADQAAADKAAADKIAADQAAADKAAAGKAAADKIAADQAAADKTAADKAAADKIAADQAAADRVVTRAPVTIPWFLLLGLAGMAVLAGAWYFKKDKLPGIVERVPDIGVVGPTNAPASTSGAGVQSQQNSGGYNVQILTFRGNKEDISTLREVTDLQRPEPDRVIEVELLDSGQNVQIHSWVIPPGNGWEFRMPLGWSYQPEIVTLYREDFKGWKYTQVGIDPPSWVHEDGIVNPKAKLTRYHFMGSGTKPIEFRIAFRRIE